MNGTDEHLTTNPDFLERFVLGKLPPEDTDAAERHIAECEECRAAVDRERHLVAGVRLHARESLKKRLAARIRALPQQRTPWPHILSAAALLAVVAGVGVYYEWFAQEKPIPTQPMSQEILPSVTESPAESKRQEPALKAEHQLQDREIAPEDKQAEPSPALKGQADKKRDKGGSTSTLEPGAADMADALSKEKQEEIRTSSQNKALAAEAPASETTLSGGTTVRAQAKHEYWAEGIIMADYFNRGTRWSGKNVPGRSTEQPKDVAEDQKFILQQKPAAALPVRQQQMLGANRRTIIPTLVEQEGQVTQLTLFTSAPVDSTALRTATVRQVEPDSILVNIGGMTLGYRLSPARR